MKRALLVGGIVLVMAATACTNRRGQTETSTQLPPPENMRRCDEVFVEGQTIDRGTFTDACRTGDEMAVPRPVQFECEDGRTFVWNDFAWGYVGEPMTLVVDPDDRSAPVQEAMSCLGSGAESAAAGGGQTPPTTAAEPSAGTGEGGGDAGTADG
jgi:hypothetical protein